MTRPIFPLGPGSGPRGPEGPRSTIPGPRGDRGLPGVNAVENDEAVAAYIADPTSEVASALSALIAAATSGAGATGYDIVLLLGQSNMQGYGGGATDALLDIASPQVWAYNYSGSSANKIVQATEPLYHVQAASDPIGPGMEFARWYATSSRRRVLLVPAAYGGSAFAFGSPRWDTAYPDVSSSLYNIAIHQAQNALAAAGPGSRIAAALWVQGETDALNSLSGPAYRTHLEYLIDGLRDRLDVPDLPFVVGSMLPEFVATGQGTVVAVDAVHRNTPTRKKHTGFAQGPTGTDRGDHLHYKPEGSRALGRSMVDGLVAAIANTSPANEQPYNPPAIPTTPPAPITPVADNFNRADSASSIGTTSTGGLPWQVQGAGTLGVLSGALYASAYSSGYVFATVDNQSADATVQIKVVAADGASLLVWRFTDPANWYGLLLASGQVYKSVAGALSLIGSTPGVGVGDTAKVVYSGSTFTVSKNGTAASPIVDTSLDTGNKAGLGLGSTVSRLDDFSLVVP